MAKKRRANEVRLFGGVRRDRRALMMTTALQATALLVLAVPGQAQPAPNARPMGGQEVVGQASISASASTTAITQGSQRAAIDWRSFDVGSQHSVTFAQPSSSAIALNRVIGPDPSQIAGKISANGQVALVNQSGVVFYKGSQANVSSLIVSAAGITNQNFAAGKMIFDQPARPNARIENHGNITVKETGLAALVAPQVVNSGTITAKLGHVVLAGATTHTVVDLYGDGLLSIDVTGQVKQVPVGPDGKKATALVTNTGVIAADGGTITLTAQAADGIVQNLVSAGGKLRANSAGDKTGTIRVAGIGGSVTIEGAATAEGVAAGTRGGPIELAASNAVRVASGATVNATGRAGGGTVAVGTTLARARGGSGVRGMRTAKSAVVEPGATIRADATARGDGGRIVLLSTEKTDHAGTITARGGAQGGNGGFVEVSGNKGFALTGSVDLATPAGHVGTVLIDPTNLDIISPPPGSLDSGFTGTVSAGSSPGNQTISSSVVNTMGGGASVILQATDTLSVNAPISFSGHALTLPAGNNLLVNQSINTSGAITLSAADPTITGAGSSAAGALTINASVSTTGTINLSAGTGGINIGSLVNGGSVNLSTPGGVAEPAGSVNAGTLTGTVGGAVLLNQPTNQVANLGTFTAGGGFTLRNGIKLDVTGAVQVGDGRTLALRAPAVTLTGGSLIANAIISVGLVTPGMVELQADSMSLAAGTISAPDGMVTLSRLTPGILSLDPATVGGRLSLTQADLDSIHTLGSTTGPLGTQTVVLGSLDGLNPDPNTTQLQINTSLYGFTGIARTLA
jgi:filamentous hemagglutinin family protein